jgi:hypothetical protein
MFNFFFNRNILFCRFFWNKLSKELKHKIKYFIAEIYNKIFPNIICSDLYKNKFKGERCFIIGGGSSLKSMDLSVLNNEYTMAVNQGFKLNKLGLNKATFYGIADGSAIADYGDKIPTDFAKYYCFFGYSKLIKKFPNYSIFNCYLENSGKSLHDYFYQFDLNRILANCNTIVLYMLQVATWLGFSKIYFIGVDNNFHKTFNTNMHWYKDSESERYNIKAFNTPRAINLRSKSFKFVYKVLSENDINIYNASIAGDLNEIPRVNFKNLFDKKI